MIAPLGTSNYSFYAVPAAWGLSILSHWYGIYLFNTSRKGDDEWNNAAPRQQVASLSQKEKLSPVEHKVLRAEAASQNGFENLAFFASAVVAANYAGLPASTLNSLAAFYLASRVVYSVLYVQISSNRLSKLRSVVFVAGVGAVFTLFIKAGNALNALR